MNQKYNEAINKNKVKHRSSNQKKNLVSKLDKQQLTSPVVPEADEEELK